MKSRKNHELFSQAGQLAFSKHLRPVCTLKNLPFPSRVQLLGFDVDPLNSVQLSNHTGYSAFKGQRLNGTELEAVVEGLTVNGLMGAYSHVLTGYVSTESFLRAIMATVREVKRANPRAAYVCDPVLGDNGRLYVPKELVPVYRQDVLPLADIITPNQFEAEQLAGRGPITDVTSALAAIDALHACGVPTVVMTSSDVSLLSGESAGMPDYGSGSGARASTDESACGSADDVNGASSPSLGSMLLIASCPWDAVTDDVDNGFFTGVDRTAFPRARFCVEIPRLRADFTGTGDMTAALLLAHSHAHPRSLVTAVEKTIATVQAVCKRTIEQRDSRLAAVQAESEGKAAKSWLSSAWESTPAADRASGDVPAFAELCLIQSRGDIEAPPLEECKSPALRAKPLFV